MLADGIPAIEELAHFARHVNGKTENIGARRLHTILERLLEDVLFDAPFPEVRTIVYDRERVKAKLAPLMDDPNTAQRVL